MEPTATHTPSVATKSATAPTAEHPADRLRIVSTPGICGGRPRIDGHRIQVEDVAIWHERMGMSPDEIVSEHPSIMLADVHAALAYYYENRERIDADIEAAKQFAQQMKTKAAIAHPPSVVGSGTTVSKVMPEMSRTRLGFDARPSTVNTSPGVAPLIVKKSASMFPNTVLLAVAVPPALSVISACTNAPKLPLLLLKNNPTSKVLGTLPFTVKAIMLLNPDEAGAKAKPLFMSPPDGLSILRKPDAVWTLLKPDPGTVGMEVT